MLPVDCWLWLEVAFTLQKYNSSNLYRSHRSFGDIWLTWKMAVSVKGLADMIHFCENFTLRGTGKCAETICWLQHISVIYSALQSVNEMLTLHMFMCCLQTLSDDSCFGSNLQPSCRMVCQCFLLTLNLYPFKLTLSQRKSKLSFITRTYHETSRQTDSLINRQQYTCPTHKVEPKQTLFV